MFKLLLKFKVFVIGLFLGIILVSVFVFYKKTSSRLNLPDLYAENISDQFYAYATKITGKQSLYVAKLQQVEILERKSTAKALWFDLPDIILKVQVPVEYNYYISFSSEWKFEVQENILVVTVPDMTTSRPAVDLAQLEFSVKKGSLLRGESAPLKRLEKDLPGILVDRSLAHRELVREQARESVAAFIKNWIKQTSGKDLQQVVQIRFVGEEVGLQAPPKSF